MFLNRLLHLTSLIFLFVPLDSLSGAHAQDVQPPCIVDMPVYGPSGERLSFKVIAVTAADDKDIDFLSAKPDGVVTTAKEDKVVFSSNRIVGGRPIEVRLQGPKGAVVVTQFIVTSCRLRRSLSYGQSATGADVSGNLVTGRLAGCEFGGDWWIRAAPLFGGHDQAHIVDGYVQADGSFSVVLGDLGIRHLFIIGKGKQPIKVIAANITTGKKTDLGLLKLGAHCPKN